MSRFTNTIEKLKSSQSTISDALNEKLGNEVGGGLTYKFSEMADKIREIEVGGKYKVIVDFDSYYGSGYEHIINLQIYENDSKGIKILDINETKFPSTQDNYTYSFDTDVDKIYIVCNPIGINSHGVDIVAPNFYGDQTLTDLKKHKTIKIDYIGMSISYTD